MTNTIANTELVEHIREKIIYHRKLIFKYEAEEDYLKCAYHRDEITRLEKLV